MARVRVSARSADASAVRLRLLSRLQHLRGRGLVALLAALRFAAGHLPRVGLGERTARLAGDVWYLAAPAARAAVRDNLRHVLGREPDPREVRQVFQNGALNYWETLAVSHLERQQVLDLVSLDGVEHLDRALARGHGAIVVGAHLGSLALAAQVLPARGYPVVGLLEPIQPPELFDFFARQRRAFGMRLLPTTSSAIRELLATLRRNEVVALVTDRDVTGSGPTIDFFGAPTRFPDGAARLSIRTGAPILPGLAVRQADGRFAARIEPPLELPGTGDAQEDVRWLIQAVARRLEYHIASHPLEWTVFQRRWPEAQLDHED